MKRLKRYRLSVLAATGVVAVGAWMLVGCSKQLAGNEAGAPVEVALPALVIEPSQALFFGSSTGNPDSASTQETSPNSDLFSVQVVDPAATAAAETTPSKASTSLSNVWVLQFDGGGTTRACVYVGTVNAGSNILATLESGEGYSVWVVANGPGNGSFTTSNPATLSDFESKLLYTGNTTADSQIPLCGKIENVTVLKNGQLLVGNNNAVVPSVLLRRAQARVDMILEYDVDGAVFDGAWLYNVPTGACYGLLESAADGFPEAASGNFNYTEGLLEGATHVQGTQNANSTYTWYMGDNRRGTNSSILFEVQKHQANAPQYATYIRIKGHEEADETKYLFHDVYLGKTKTSDFNVLRNWSYTFRVRIGGTLAQQKALAAEDPRVSAGVLSLMESATVTPDPTKIPQEGGEYTITIKGLWAGEMPVRIWDGKTALDEGTITYSSESQGGSTTLTVSSNETGIVRSAAFQYYWENNWITIIAGQQKAVPSIDIPGGDMEVAIDQGNGLTWDEAVDYCSNKGDGWRLPTQNELMYLWCIAPSITGEAAFSGSLYWSSTGNSSGSYWFTNFSTGGTSTTSPSNSFNVRCVKTGSNRQYPYITTASDGGVIIVLQDEQGGIDDAALFSTTLDASLTGNEQTTDNRMSRKFRVQQTNQGITSWDQAVNYCNNLETDGYTNWRMPTQRELMLIWVLGGASNVSTGEMDFSTNKQYPFFEDSQEYLHQQSQFTAFDSDTWSATEYSPTVRCAWRIGFGSGITYDHVYVFDYSFRCVRDEW